MKILSANRIFAFTIVKIVILVVVSQIIFSCTFTASQDQSTNSGQAQKDTTKKSGLSDSTPVPVTTRYPNGKDLSKPQNTGGRGNLKISNGTNSDAIAKLVDIKTNKTIRSVYIRANEDFTIEKIKAGEYSLKFSLGNDYIVETGKFLNNQSYSQFPEPFDFGELREDGKISIPGYEVTLNPVADGTIEPTSINEADFEDK